VRWRPLPFGYREAQRLRQIINVLVKYGFGWVVEKTGLSYLLSVGRRILRFKERAPLTPAQRLRRVLEELGPSFIKLGQILSTRPDLLPLEFIQELQKLRDEVEPAPWEKVESFLREEWGEGWRSLVDIPQREPLASASIAQVYRGDLVSGETVVVKVLRPGIRETVERDIEVMRFLARLVDRYLPELRIYHPVDLVEEFAFTIRREMDFTVEAASAEKIRANFRGVSWVVIPQVHWDLTTSSVLVMERVEGIPLDRPEELDSMGIERRLVAKRLAMAFMKQVLEDGFFHADPHPSNLLVGGKGELVYVDFGMMGYLDRAMRNSIASLLIQIVKRNYDGIIRIFKKVGVVEEALDERRFKLELMGLLEPYFSRSLEGMPLGDAVNQVIHLSLRYRVRFPPELYLLGRALVLVDSDLRYLDPHLNVIELVAPFALRIMKSRRTPRALRESFEEEIEFLKEGVRTLPFQFLQALQKFNRGEVKVTFVHEGLEEMVEGMERSSLRLTVTLLFILFVLLGTWTMGLPWAQRFTVCGIPLFSLFSYGLAGFMAFFLVGSVLFRRR